MIPAFALRAAVILFFFFNDTATTEIYTLSLHDALPILNVRPMLETILTSTGGPPAVWGDRKSTRLNSSHGSISYAVFCLKHKNTSRTCCPGHLPQCCAYPSTNALRTT